MSRQQTTAALAFVVGLMWLASGVASLLTGNSATVAAISPVMAVVLGFYMSSRNGKNGNGKNGKNGNGK